MTDFMKTLVDWMFATGASHVEWHNGFLPDVVERFDFLYHVEQNVRTLSRIHEYVPHGRFVPDRVEREKWSTWDRTMLEYLSMRPGDYGFYKPSDMLVWVL